MSQRDGRYHVRSTPPDPFTPGDLVVWGSGNLGVIATADGFVDISADALNSLGDFRTTENNVPGILTTGRDGDTYFLPTGPGKVTTFDEVVFSIPGQQALRFSAGSVNHTSRGFELTRPVYWGKPVNGLAISHKQPHGQ